VAFHRIQVSALAVLALRLKLIYSRTNDVALLLKRCEVAPPFAPFQRVGSQPEPIVHASNQCQPV